MRLLTVFGTRPEAIKLAPVLQAARAEASIQSLICVTGQHRGLLDQALSVFEIVADFDLDLMEPEQELSALASRAFAEIDSLLESLRPDRVIVQGDTTTAFAAAYAAYHRRIPVGHVEAGLRTYSPLAPWPEETNRRAIALICDLHFAPTAAAKANLCSERLHGEVFVTGNTGIDALHIVLRRLVEDEDFRRKADSELPPEEPGKKLLLVTGHRRETLGAPFLAICEALTELASRDDLRIIFPLHPNPAVRTQAEASLAGRPNVHLVPALGFPAFVRLMQRADLIVTDSGGVQEEAAALGKPILVTRELTERTEAVGTGAARLVGIEGQQLVRLAATQLEEGNSAAGFAAPTTIYGDGQASGRIIDALLGRPVEEFDGEPFVASARGVTAAAE